MVFWGVVQCWYERRTAHPGGIKYLHTWVFNIKYNSGEKSLLSKRYICNAI